MKTTRGTDMHPEVGFAFVKFIPPGETEGGLHMPESAQTREGRLVVLETSGAYVVDGLRQECSASPGDRVWLNPHKEKVQIHGRWQEVMRPKLSPLSCGEENVFLCMLADVTHYERPERALNS